MQCGARSMAVTSFLFHYLAMIRTLNCEQFLNLHVGLGFIDFVFMRLFTCTILYFFVLA